VNSEVKYSEQVLLSHRPSKLKNRLRLSRHKAALYV
jgi:hypothetical protein